MNDVDFMQRALALAAQGIGRTGDNPSVGCVIVKDGALIAEARTADGGRPHAEEVALAAAGASARGATTYVTLEPCARRSSGAPGCATRLADAGVMAVIFACADPHTLARGEGPAQLTRAGIIVRGGLMEAEAAPLYAVWAAEHEQ